MRWTGPQIHRQLPEINVIAASMGTAGKAHVVSKQYVG